MQLCTSDKIKVSRLSCQNSIKLFSEHLVKKYTHTTFLFMKKKNELEV